MQKSVLVANVEVTMCQPITANQSTDGTRPAIQDV